MKKMYGLFLYEYDWHEWAHLQCACSSPEKLIEAGNSKILYEKPYSNLHPEVVFDERTHRELAEDEVPHYMIKEIEVI